MQNLDIPFPETEYEFVSQFKDFNLIYPHTHPLCQAIKIDMVVRTLSFSDNEYGEFLNNTKKPQDMTPVGGRLLEINYIRECSAKDVAKFEWEKNYGPSSLKEFLKVTKQSDADSYVKVIHLKIPNYSLKLLNQIYGTN